MSVIESQARTTLLDRREKLALAAPSPQGLREAVEIDAALERLAAGTYGICQQCGRPIGRQRLRAIPEARHCVSCSAAP